jgi:hypothetical protein
MTDTPYPPVVDGVVLADVEHEIRELVDGCSSMGDQTPAAHIARLGLALAALTRVLPQIAPPASQDYFRLLESAARAALTAVVMRQHHDCEGD